MYMKNVCVLSVSHFHNCLLSDKYICQYLRNDHGNMRVFVQVRESRENVCTSAYANHDMQTAIKQANKQMGG